MQNILMEEFMKLRKRALSIAKALKEQNFDIFRTEGFDISIRAKKRNILKAESRFCYKGESVLEELDEILKRVDKETIIEGVLYEDLLILGKESSCLLTLRKIIEGDGRELRVFEESIVSTSEKVNEKNLTPLLKRIILKGGGSSLKWEETHSKM